MLEYLIVYPLLFLIGLVDTVHDWLAARRRRALHRNAPDAHAVHSARLDPTSPASPYRCVLSARRLMHLDDAASLYEGFRAASKAYADLRTMGVRETLGYEDEVQENGKVFKKKIMRNEYTWMTYREALENVDHIANGLLKLGIKSDDNIVIFAETRREWLMSAFACFKIKVPIVTLYATLGLDALTYGINQSDASYLIASSESFNKLEKVLDRVPNLKCIIVISDKLSEAKVIQIRASLTTHRIHTYDEVVEMGRTTALIDAYTRPKADDLAVIMYTSGSTGNPKGVMITHRNLLTSLSGYIKRCRGPPDPLRDAYVAYLPLAHVFEMVCEIGFAIEGIPIGYSSPFTLTDTSTAIKSGQLGDMRVLKPTYMAGVPLVLERLKKAVGEKMAKQSALKQLLFRLGYEQKLGNLRADRSSFLLDKILFSKINEATLGGNMKRLIVGGALMNKDIHDFGQVCLCTIIEAYGLTETSAGATMQFPNETATGEVGCPTECCEIRLVDWAEGNYRATDRPNPRGEIWIGGDHVTMGYYKMPDKTAEDYHVIDGVRYFATGDIGEMSPLGNLRIVDRKKDLVKLEGGEYVSLNKVEAVVKLLSFVDNCCVVARYTETFCVCLVSANVKKVGELMALAPPDADEVDSSGRLRVADKIDLRSLERQRSFEVVGQLVAMLESDAVFRSTVNAKIAEHCLKNGLERFEVPRRFRFVKETWLPDTGLVTDSLKLKRKEIERFYEREIDELYSRKFE